jgi:hypothetical protein
MFKKMFSSLLILVVLLYLTIVNAFSFDLIFNWLDSDAPDFSHYAFWQSDDGCVTYQSHVLRALSNYRMNDVQLPDGDYCWDVTAFDTTGNESAHSVEKFYLTLPLPADPPPDKDPPGVPISSGTYTLMTNGIIYLCTNSGCLRQ